MPRSGNVVPCCAAFFRKKESVRQTSATWLYNALFADVPATLAVPKSGSWEACGRLTGGSARSFPFHNRLIPLSTRGKVHMADIAQQRALPYSDCTQSARRTLSRSGFRRPVRGPCVFIAANDYLAPAGLCKPCALNISWTVLRGTPVCRESSSRVHWPRRAVASEAIAAIAFAGRRHRTCAGGPHAPSS